MCTTSAVAIFALKQDSTVRLKILRNRSAANACQARMIRQFLVKRIARKPANGDINMGFPHQPAIVHNPTQQASKHQPDRSFRINAGPTVVATIAISDLAAQHDKSRTRLTRTST